MFREGHAEEVASKRRSHKEGDARRKKLPGALGDGPEGGRRWRQVTQLLPGADTCGVLRVGPQTES